MILAWTCRVPRHLSDRQGASYRVSSFGWSPGRCLRAPSLRRRVWRPARAPKCIPGTGEALLGSSNSKDGNGKGDEAGMKVDELAVEALKKRVKELEERLEQVEGQMSQMSEQVRDRAVTLLEAIREPSPDKLEALQLEGAAGSSEAAADLDGLITGFTEVMAKGYLEAVSRLRDRLLVSEWELALKPLAMRQGVAAFEEYCAEKQIRSVPFETLTQLYEDPTNLDVIEDPILRLRARACINQAVVAAQQAAYQSCTEQAQALASQFSQGDFISKLLPEGGVMDALKAVVPHAVRAVLPGN